jgi:predicted DNA-binding transcriptional regulator AlpA
MSQSRKTAPCTPSRTKTNALPDLPADLARHRILDSQQSAAFLNISLPHFRRLYRAKRVPEPIKLSSRKLGWKAGDLIAWLDSRETRAAAPQPRAA